jgi:hypothetical protein
VIGDRPNFAFGQFGLQELRQHRDSSLKSRGAVRAIPWYLRVAEYLGHLQKLKLMVMTVPERSWSFMGIGNSGTIKALKIDLITTAR